MSATDRQKLAETPTRVIDEARFNELALLILGGVRDPNELAERMGVKKSRYYEISRDPRFAVIFERAKDEMFSNLATVIEDEKRDIVLRQQAQAARAVTLLSEVTEEVRSRVRNRSAKSADLRVGVDAAIAAIDRAPGGVRARREASINVKNAVFIPTASQARAISEAYEESGVDMSDLIPVQQAGPVVDVEPTCETATETAQTAPTDSSPGT